MEKSPNQSESTGIYNIIISSFGDLLNKIRQHFVLFILCVGISIAAAVFMQYKNANLYVASFTVTYDELVRKIYGDRLTKLNELVQKQDYSKISYLLSVDRPDASSLVDIKGINILGQDLEGDLNTDKIPFIIKITVKDTASVMNLQNGILGFLEEGNKYLIAKKAIKVKEIDEELKFIDEQLNMMDSLKKLYNRHSFSSDDKPGSSVSSLYQFSFDLYKRKQDLMRKKEFPDNLQIIDDAIVPVHKGRSLVINAALALLAGTIIFFALVYFVIPIFRYREK